MSSASVRVDHPPSSRSRSVQYMEKHPDEISGLPNESWTRLKNPKDSMYST